MQWGRAHGGLADMGAGREIRDRAGMATLRGLGTSGERGQGLIHGSGGQRLGGLMILTPRRPEVRLWWGGAGGFGTAGGEE